MEEDPTQPLTQQVLDPRRIGRNNSGLSESDVSDVLCILHPASPAAFRIVDLTSQRTPQHILQNDEGVSFATDGNEANIEEQETFILSNSESMHAQDLALRFSSPTIQPVMGFCFGRNPAMCDIVFGVDSAKRISNTHFRIYINDDSILMLEDMSTNGTLVDDKHLKGKDKQIKGKNSTAPSTRMLNPGSIIQIPSSNPTELIKFIVRIPSREGYEEEYNRKYQAYRYHLDEFDRRFARANNVAQQLGNGRVERAPFADMPGASRALRPPVTGTNYTYGMHWNGGDEYNVIGHLGKGAFATVYKLATAMDGQPLAAKELEKKRFIKNGQLDQRLDNEMQIMKTLRHPNIVQYVDYRDVGNYLYIIMEYVPCGDLQGYLQLNGILGEASARLMARQILHALAYLHQMKITHRDIKPDNILIASLNPFAVKLSDFGLSKVVKNNETFLKTFCGTLLYCAPEVFPHYDLHPSKKGMKRRRTGGVHHANTFHSYSQCVDIWSFAAVLWFSLCGKPPFEGVVDATGRGMFDRIMETRLDIGPLKAHGVSDEAIDLLLRMLNTDPSARPSESDCLRHPWLADGAQILVDIKQAPGLNAIAEEEEEAEGALSQLSINEPQGSRDYLGEEDDNFDSGDFDFLDPRQSKRVRADQLLPRNQFRDQAAIDSSPEVSHHFTLAQPHASHEGQVVPPQPTHAPRLFGEIGQSALQSSGVLGVRTNVALAMTSSAPDDTDTSSAKPHSSLSQKQSDYAQRGSRQSGHIDTEQYNYSFSDDDQAGPGAAASLMGAESLVRELNMESPHPVSSPLGVLNEPSTPKTPDRLHDSANSHDGTQGSQKSRPEDVTPKPPVFSRQIQLTISPSFYYDPLDPTTHTLEYASKVSGRDFVGIGNEFAGSALGSLPETMHSSPQSSHLPVEDPSIAVDADYPSEFLRPPPRLGRLTSTKKSFTQITLKLEDRTTTWGRDPSNTIIYANPLEVRIPKRVMIQYCAPGIEKAERNGEDWTKMDGLYTAIHTLSKIGVRVNGVRLTAEDEHGRTLYGKLYSGDVITIFQIGERGSGLHFVCELFHGEAANPRPDEEMPFKVLCLPVLKTAQTQ